MRIAASDALLVLEGAVRTSKVGTGVRPYRTLSVPYGGDAPGVRLRIRTDSSRVSFDVEHLAKKPGLSRQGVWTVREDGCPPTLVDGPVGGRIRIEAPPGRGLRDLELFTPYGDEVVLHGVDLDDDADVRRPCAPDGRVEWLALGDSITQGFSASGSHAGWVERTRAALGWRALNGGIGSHFARPMDAGLADGHAPDVITVAFGINDCLLQRGAEQFGSDVAGLLQGLRFRAAFATLVVVTPTPHEAALWPRLHDLEKYRDAARAAGNEGGALVLEGADLLPAANLSQLTTEDRLHPSDDGFAHMANVAAPMLEAAARVGIRARSGVTDTGPSR